MADPRSDVVCAMRGCGKPVIEADKIFCAECEAKREEHKKRTTKSE